MIVSQDNSSHQRTTLWLAGVVLLIVGCVVWKLWVGPLVTLCYYRYCSVSTARVGLTSQNEFVRRAAAGGLGHRGRQASEAIPDLRFALDDPAPQVASSAAWALGYVLATAPDRPTTCEAEVVGALEKKLKHEDWGVRRYAAYALSLLEEKPR